MRKYKIWTGGEWVGALSGKTYRAINPATEEEIAEIPLGSKEDITKAVAAAKKAFPVWSKKSQDERTGILNQIATIVREYIPELAKFDTMDHGTPGKMAVGMMRDPKQLEWAGASCRSGG
jgi:acyl-CoA reductase-like NAD-dependent aldehyde dehydrogenase